MTILPMDKRIANNPFVLAERARIVTMWLSGMSARNISVESGASLSTVYRHMGVGVAAGVVVEAGWVLSQDQLVQDHLLQGLWGDTRTTCRALILDLTAKTSTDVVLKSSGYGPFTAWCESVQQAYGPFAGVKRATGSDRYRGCGAAGYMVPLRWCEASNRLVPLRPGVKRATGYSTTA
ncbi:hypothetical protein Hamer_G007875, partial [Homarus americanus]